METLSRREARRLALARAGLLNPEWTRMPRRASGAATWRNVSSGGAPSDHAASSCWRSTASKALRNGCTTNGRLYRHEATTSPANENVSVEPVSCTLAALTVAVVSALSDLVVRRRLDRLDIVAVLKSRE